MVWLLAVLIGTIAGLRVFTALAALCWAVALARLDLSQTGLAFLGWRYLPAILSLLAVIEFITDQLPTTPSRKVPSQFGARLIAGALGGAAFAAAAQPDQWQSAALIGAVPGLVGAVIGTLGGAAARARLAHAFGSDRPAALIEDVVAIGAACALVAAL